MPKDDDLEPDFIPANPLEQKQEDSEEEEEELVYETVEDVSFDEEDNSFLTSDEEEPV